MAKRATQTTTAGAPVADNKNSITAGPRGPFSLEEYQLVEKLAYQNRERIPERTTHAKGWGAFGRLTITGDISNYTKATCPQPGAKTDMTARFSTVAGELGAADAERNVRGFALKFYTEDGKSDWLATIRRYALSAIPTNFQISSARKSVTRAPTCGQGGRYAERSI